MKETTDNANKQKPPRLRYLLSCSLSLAQAIAFLYLFSAMWITGDIKVTENIILIRIIETSLFAILSTISMWLLIDAIRKI